MGDCVAAPDAPAYPSSALALADGDCDYRFPVDRHRLDLWNDHSAARSGAEKESANLARSFDESIARTIEAVDQTLLFIREGHQQGRSAFDVQGWARGRSFFNDLHMQISIVDRNGWAVSSDLGPVDPNTDVSDREHFRFQLTSQDDTLFISRPVIGRVSNRSEY